MRTARSLLAGLAATTLLLLLAAHASAQVGVPNTPFVPPGPLPPPFGAQPHPFNDFHPVEPWSGIDRVVRVFEVPARTLVLPMEVAQPGSLPVTIESQEVTLPGYLVSEMIRGWIVHAHWGVEPVGTAYYWTWRPTYFVAK